MIHTITLNLPLEDEASDSMLRTYSAHALGIPRERIYAVKKRRRSLDARSQNITVHVRLDVYVDTTPTHEEYYFHSRDVSSAEHVLIIGAGPAGLFAALRFIELGIKPIILERGKDVQARRRDIATLTRQHSVNSDSNYCFGEGGAGTYSDGKLYTRSTKRGNVRKILETFVAHGASEDILIEAHPHIGTNKLPSIIAQIRQSILQSGGEIHFNTRVTDLLLRNNRIEGVHTATEQEFLAQYVLLATGHSARDIFELLQQRRIAIEPKPFAVGLRVEHPQSLIDAMQYHMPTAGTARHALLPPAAYRWAEQVYDSHSGKWRGVFSFCMCPGGIIAPCATAPQQIVTNGWSPSKRNNPYANSGVVVTIDIDDVLSTYAEHGALAGVRFQQELEYAAWQAGSVYGLMQAAPAQRMVDFVCGKLSDSLPQTSYTPGITSAPLHDILPSPIAHALQQAFTRLSYTMKPYFTNDAVLHGVETRTSSPVRIPRRSDTLEHIHVRGLYPCGEGAGYAGGIISAAIDGQRCAEAIYQALCGKALEKQELSCNFAPSTRTSHS
ncbi:MAG: FAD-binding protein [Bacteroidota bacterium]|nr:FAD-binding protein [Candidatus Kapabacteria bacterium]MDW8219986.1 FAD-binding protein [Bacteroidota bacterium]